MIRVSSRWVALFYFAIALPWMVWWAIWVPPVQGPDEGAHLARADQISHGALIAQRLTPDEAGGRIDLGVIELIRRFGRLPSQPQRKADPSLYAPVPWGLYRAWSFPNTAIYPPVFYLPAAGALYTGRTLGFDVLRSTQLARLALGSVAVMCASLIISLAGPAAIYLFTLLLLPASLQLMTLITQDGGMLLSAAAIGVVFLRGERRGIWVAAALLACLGSCRPPYAALSILTLAWPGQTWRRRAAACAVAMLGAGGWIALTEFATYVPFPPANTVNASAQWALSLAHPLHLPQVILRTVVLTIKPQLAPSFVSLTMLPKAYTQAAIVCIVLAAWAAWRGAGLLDSYRTVLLGCVVLCASAGIFAIEYLTWTQVGENIVHGVQGRYFLPLLATLPICLASGRATARRVPVWIQAPLLFFPFISIVTSLWRLSLLY